MKIFIDNEEVICDKNIVIEEEMLNTPSVILNNVYPKSWEDTQDYTSLFYHPKDYSQCRIYDDNDNLLFCGVVKNSGNISLNPRYPHYQTLQILSYKTFLSEGETLDYVLVDKTIEEAIEEVIDTISPYGFVKGNIQLLNAMEVIGAYSTKDKTAYDVFNYLADITQSRWTTRLVDEDTVAIDFYDPLLLPQGLQIDYTKEFFETYQINDISYSYGTNDYRNKQVMTSNQVYGTMPQLQTIFADSYQQQFLTELPVGQIQSIVVNGVNKSYAKMEEKDLGVDADFYYSINSNLIESENTLSAGAKVEIMYIPIVEGRQIITNSNEIDRISNSTGVKGVIARYENRNDAITSGELQAIGQSYIKYKGVAEINLKVESELNLWNIGDRVYFDAPIEALQTEYMVKKKIITRFMPYPSTEEEIFYTYELTSSFNSENAINYFDNQRAKAKGNIKDGEFVSRNVDIDSTANVIFFEGTIKEVEPEGNNALNSILNSPFTI